MRKKQKIKTTRFYVGMSDEQMALIDQARHLDGDPTRSGYVARVTLAAARQSIRAHQAKEQQGDEQGDSQATSDGDGKAGEVG